MNEMFNEYRALFIEEAEEYVAALNGNLVALEKDPSNRKLIDNIFRVAHTLKSSAAAVGLSDLSGLSHKAEDVMQKVRSGEIAVSTAVFDAFFEVFDVIRAYVEAVKNDRRPDKDMKGILERLEGVKNPGPELASILPSGIPAHPARSEIELSVNEMDRISSSVKSGTPVYRLDVVIDSREQLKWLRAELLLNKASSLGTIIKIFPEKSTFIRNDFDGIFSLLLESVEPLDRLREEVIVDLIQSIDIIEFRQAESGPADEPSESFRPAEKDSVAENVFPPAGTGGAASRIEAEPVSGAKREHSKVRATDTIRVGIDKLDVMMNLIGELATTLSGFRQIERKALQRTDGRDNDIVGLIDRLSNISSDLQFSIMTTRMLPVSNVFNQYGRVVRDLCRTEGKEVNLVIRGEDTELDKKIIDTIGEPLTHLIRNAVGHGIESAEVRRQAGKPASATVTLSAERTGTRIMVSVADDGGGIDVIKVRKKAVSNGLVSQAEADIMDDEQVLQYIFHPGFSTAESVTDVSGRGVGLDVVKNVVSELNGTIEVRTRQGAGMEFVILLPLTLTTTGVILVRAVGGLYAVPISDIIETITVRPEEFRFIDGTMAYNLRDEVLPVVSLSEVFEGKSGDPAVDRLSVMVVYYKGQKIGLVIDGIEGDEEIVLKNLEKNYKALKGISGAAILGDGRISLVLDIPGIVQIIREKRSAKPSKTTERHGRSRSRSRIRGAEKKNGGGEKDRHDRKDLFRRTFDAAAESLSQLTGRRMSIRSGVVNEYGASEELVNNLSENPGDVYVGSLIKTREGLESNIVFLIPDSESRELYDLLNFNEEGTTSESGDDVVLAMGEINNILSSAFINTAADILGREVHPSTPKNNRDMLGALMEGVAMQEELIDRKVLCAETVITGEGQKEFHPRLLIIADPVSLERIQAPVY
jgi:two-component system chemotaxis sensor kinase CheA